MGRAPTPEGVAVGERIRLLRKKAGLSSGALAEHCGISQPFLSQLERGVATPSLTTLYLLADTFGVHPGALLENRPQAPVSVTTPADRQVIRVGEGNHQMARALIPGGLDTMLEAYEHTFDPGAGDRDWFEHPGEDFIYVLSGTVELQLRGHDPVLLTAGQTALHTGLVPHRCVLVGSRPARTILVSRHG
ncbi:helix-turn-helix domain-containing protein [Rhodococcus triatomae]|uniref:Cupin domain-containing protein n=1 Tax=Rhodococcus triatomae TaxID=300028 RepID=A0A1G8GJD7_9NOCA|nr:XRE family transcriptional regulator [Rhodococcus triatomae]QNG20363.1 helix-turn-helix domain-containing protein [Rhodococcus triatomae]QNG23721.1 helix-turn-helix domain-containing protein [Rhodococcus triatomae]SDH94417.1 Cupin domain-containing protein [Rhodococcus triatomae]